VVDEPVARKKGVAPILGRNEHVPSIYILQPTFEQIVVERIISNHRDASVRYLFKKPEDPLDGWSFRSLAPLDFLERHRGRDQIDLSVTLSCKKPIEGPGLRGIVILHDNVCGAGSAEGGVDGHSLGSIRVAALGPISRRHRT
jgi:hypothetical protein